MNISRVCRINAGEKLIRLVTKGPYRSVCACRFDAVIKIWEHSTIHNSHIKVGYLNIVIALMLDRCKNRQDDRSWGFNMRLQIRCGRSRHSEGPDWAERQLGHKKKTRVKSVAMTEDLYWKSNWVNIQKMQPRKPLSQLFSDTDITSFPKHHLMLLPDDVSAALWNCFRGA